MGSRFQYQNLPQQQIRLLTPKRSTAAKDLRFSLKAVSAASSPSYVAISYTWGTGTANKCIYLNDAKVWIRPNLWWCLYYMRLKPEWRYVWVDFICIDQENVQERNEQVHAMDSIYSNASLVVAWLGLEEETPNWKSYVPMEGLMYDSLDMQDSAMDLASRPYWNRRWVVQELLLAVDVAILCGGHCISWSTFKSWLLDDEDGLQDLVSSDVGALPFLINKDEDLVHYPSHSLQDLLLAYRHTNCHDPRDRVFALIGLLSNEERLLIDPVFPNYSLSHNDVVARTLEHLGGLRLKKHMREKQLVVTDDCRELLDALGFKNMRRAKELLCPDTS